MRRQKLVESKAFELIEKISDEFFTMTAHTYLDCKNFTPKELKVNRVIACADYELDDLFNSCSKHAQIELLEEDFLLNYQIERVNNKLELIRLNSLNYNHELTESELDDEKLELIISNFPVVYHRAVDKMLDVIYEHFTKSDSYSKIITRFDKFSLRNSQMLMFSMHQNTIHCSFETCEAMCGISEYVEDESADNLNDSRNDVTLQDIAHSVERMTSKLDDNISDEDVEEFAESFIEFLNSLK